MELQISVENQQLSVQTQALPLVADSVGVVECVFSFDAAWDGFAKTVVFTGRSFGEPDLSVQMLVTDNLFVPPEVLRAGRLYVSVIGVRGTQRLTTAQDEGIEVVCAGKQTGSDPTQYTPPLWEQMLSCLDSLDDALF